MTIWSNYRKNFPIRYIRSGYFDRYVRRIVLQQKPKNILDIGGGITGTKALKLLGAKVYFLDPYITKKPFWAYKKINWDTTKQFDLIVARGSINYLNKKELEKIKDLLNPSGVFIANTFVSRPDPAWSEGRYVTISGKSGIERSRYNPQKNIVEHELIPSSGKKIKHTFFYYSLEDYRRIFPKLKVIKYKINSAILFTKI